MTNEFKVGQKVSGDDYERLPVGARVKEGDLPYFVPVDKTGPDTWEWSDTEGGPLTVGDSVMADTERTLTYLPEPEDKTDLYVEPEPLKEGDWVQVWARVDRADPIQSWITVHLGSDDVVAAPAYTDAMVRPAAGQTPPWVKPEQQCGSLHDSEINDVIYRCKRVAGHHSDHVGPDATTWSDDEAYGRVEVRS